MPAASRVAPTRQRVELPAPEVDKSTTEVKLNRHYCQVAAVRSIASSTLPEMMQVRLSFGHA